MKILVHYSCVQAVYCIIEDSRSQPFKFRYYEEMLKWTQLLLKIRTVIFVDDIDKVNICCLDSEVVLDCFKLQ